MKNLLWIGILFISSSWLFFNPIFTSTEPLVGMTILIIGIIFNIVGLHKNKSTYFTNKFLILTIPLIISIFFIQYPYNIGIIIMIIGLLTHAFIKYMNYKNLSTISIGLLFSGIIFIIQSVSFFAYSLIVTHIHRVDFFSPLVSFFGNLLGLKTSVNNGIVFVQTLQQTYPFTSTLEKFGFYLWFNLFIGTIVILFIFYKKRDNFSKLTIFLLLSIAYLVIRYIAFIHIYTTTTDLNIFWNPWYVFLSFLPFSFVLIKLLPLTNTEDQYIIPKNFNLTFKQIISIIMIFLFTFTLIGSAGYYDPGQLKSGRILIDEFHSDWEDSTRPLDKEWYGMLSTYNYYSLAEWLNYYFDVNRNNETLTLSLLNNYDILILKCPTNSYTSQEIYAILQFVDNGGGLYLIGDHTDVFGMNTFLNQVSQNFGIKFNTDATYELGTGMLSKYRPDDILVHPIVQHVEQIDFMTSCTLEAPLNSEDVIVGNKLISEPGTYSTENFFRESTSSPESEYGLLLQVVAVKYGKGRVVAFTDSTVFSSFSFFSDGYQDFTLGTIQYLNRINQFQYLNIVFFTVAIISFFVSIYILKNESKQKILILFIIIGIIAYPISTSVFSQLNDINYPSIENHSDFTQICFEQKHSNFNISLQPSLSLFYDEDNFGTFYVWTQRMGFVPSVEERLDNALSDGDVIVFINPVKSFSTNEINKISKYLNNGGKVLLLDSIRNSHSTANELIGNFGLWIQVNFDYQRLFVDYNSSKNNLSVGNVTSPFLSISGGEKILINNNNQTFSHLVEFYNETSGKTGKLVVIIDSYSFSDPVMGGPFTEPDEKQLQIYNTEFYIFEEILLEDKL